MDSKAHTKAVLQAFLVTFLWSSSWILIKFGLQAGLPALSFAGLRYFLAAICLMPFVLCCSTHRRKINQISRPIWIQLALLGIVFYTVTQGAQYLSLRQLPAVVVSFAFNLSPMLIAFVSGLFLKESPTMRQWVGILLTIIGTLFFFYPLVFSDGEALGYVIALIAVVAYSTSSLLGRHVNLRSGLSPILITSISMGLGGSLLVVMGGVIQGFGQLDLVQWLIIGWLAIVNTAFAFTLWNKTLRLLKAFESSVISNTMLIQIAILSWIFLSEPLESKQIFAILLLTVGTLTVQLGGVKSHDEKPTDTKFA
jgi:drug/metabolite transporter (DMT)-like permease